MELLAQWVLVGVLLNIIGALIFFIRNQSNPKAADDLKEVCMPLLGPLLFLTLGFYLIWIAYLVKKK